MYSYLSVFSEFGSFYENVFKNVEVTAEILGIFGIFLYVCISCIIYYSVSLFLDMYFASMDSFVLVLINNYVGRNHSSVFHLLICRAPCAG